MKIIDIINRAAAEQKPRFTFELLPPLKGEGTAKIFEAIDTLAPLDPAYINVTFHREDTRRTTLPNGRTETQTVRHRPGTVGISAAISKRYDIETVPHIICGGQSLYDIEDALIDMDFLGLHNVLALRGDAQKGESRFTPHPHGHSHAEGLVAQIAAMNRGHFVDSDINTGNTLNINNIANSSTPGGTQSIPRNNTPGGTQNTPVNIHSSSQIPSNSLSNRHCTDFCVGVAGYPEGHAESPSPESDIENLRKKVDAGA
ncbi:MAG: methylenetetrahydrofolate reductase, partial [Alistipes sp.]|nr:methylenetetrahydrofolate reductase [Alistipes sp.]